MQRTIRPSINGQLDRCTLADREHSIVSSLFTKVARTGQVNNKPATYEMVGTFALPIDLNWNTKQWLQLQTAETYDDIGLVLEACLLLDQSPATHVEAVHHFRLRVQRPVSSLHCEQVSTVQKNRLRCYQLHQN